MMPEAIILETLKRTKLSDIVDKIVGMETLSYKYNNIGAKIQAAEIILEYIPIDKSHYVVVGDSQEESDVSRRLGIRYIHFPRFTTQHPADKNLGNIKFIKTLSEVLDL